MDNLSIYNPELESSWICQLLPADLAMKGEMVCSNIPTTTSLPLPPKMHEDYKKNTINHLQQIKTEKIHKYSPVDETLLSGKEVAGWHTDFPCVRVASVLLLYF